MVSESCVRICDTICIFFSIVPIFQNCFHIFFMVPKLLALSPSTPIYVPLKHMVWWCFSFPTSSPVFPLKYSSWNVQHTLCWQAWLLAVRTFYSLFSSSRYCHISHCLLYSATSFMWVRVFVMFLCCDISQLLTFKHLVAIKQPP